VFRSLTILFYQATIIKLLENNFIKIENPKFTRLVVDDEYDTQAICQQIIKIIVL
jgi:hypothetical protein